MIPSDLFRRYASLAAKADGAFSRMEEAYGAELKCRIGCTDCCSAIFGLFLVEAAYLKACFDRLERKARRSILLDCKKADLAYRLLEEKYRSSAPGTGESSDFMGRERVRCPLLEDEACRLYDHRPITCRVYGIPTVIQGKARVCGRAGFRGGKTYPAFNLDEVQRELYALSRELLVRSGEPDADKAALLISVSKALQTPIEEMIAEGLG